MKTRTTNPLHKAIRMRLPVQTFEHVLNEGAAINELDADGYSPLINAIDAQLDEVALLLIDKGADIYFADARGATALYFAVMNGSWAVFMRLLKRGMDPKVNVNGWPLLNVACSRAHKFKRSDLKLTKIVNGNKVSITDPALVEKLVGKDRYAQFFRIIRHLIQLGADVNSLESNGQTGIALCASRGDLEIIDYLLSKGANVNQSDKFGLTPLHWAARKGQAEIVELLLENGAQVNATETYGFTPLHEAAENGHTQIAKMLLSCGADPSLGLQKGFGAYEVGDRAKEIAVKKGFMQLSALL